MCTRLLACQAIALCALSCCNAVDPKYAKNLTVYHINQINYTGLANMNSGDAAGDLFFFLRSATWPVECEKDPKSHNCFNPEVVATDLAATKEIIEVDSRYGAYAKCNTGPYCMCGRDPATCPAGKRPPVLARGVGVNQQHS